MNGYGSISWRLDTAKESMKTRRGTFDALYYHFIWATKHRISMIDAQIENGIKKIFFSKAKELGITVLEAEGAEDHFHVLIQAPPSITPSDIAKHLKGSSSHFVNHVILKDDKTRSLYWQDGYGVITISPGGVQNVKKYIHAQKEHHAKQRVDNDLEKCSPG
jgi:putative transposase